MAKRQYVTTRHARAYDLKQFKREVKAKPRSKIGVYRGVADPKAAFRHGLYRDVWFSTNPKVTSHYASYGLMKKPRTKPGTWVGRVNPRNKAFLHSVRGFWNDSFTMNREHYKALGPMKFVPYPQHRPGDAPVNYFSHARRVRKEGTGRAREIRKAWRARKTSAYAERRKGLFKTAKWNQK